MWAVLGDVDVFAEDPQIAGGDQVEVTDRLAEIKAFCEDEQCDELIHVGNAIWLITEIERLRKDKQPDEAACDMFDCWVKRVSLAMKNEANVTRSTWPNGYSQNQ